MKGAILVATLLLLSTSLTHAESMLFDPQGFEAYTLGTMTSGQDGWNLAYVSGQSLPIIEDLNDGTYEQALHVINPSVGHGANYQSIGPLDAGLLKISLDVKASTASARTLILQVGNNVVAGDAPRSAAYIGWGVAAGKIRQYGTSSGWFDLTALDTAWHHVDLILDLDAQTYTFNLDGGPIEANSTSWANTLDLNTTPINRVLFTAWGKGTATGDISFLLDNLTISAISVPEPSTTLLLLSALLSPALAKRRVKAGRNNAGYDSRPGVAF